MQIGKKQKYLKTQPIFSYPPESIVLKNTLTNELRSIKVKEQRRYSK